ncbi:MAG: porin, partial [Proteobacteria bacterium]|nr:porin [Pseudomonadota bacterium]
MRKVLLATTALVAMGGVSAASADVTITGGYELKYISWSDTTTDLTENNSSVVDRTSVYINFSETLDNGMSMTMYTGQDVSTSANFDDLGATISGDFGTIGIGGSESGDAFATATDVTADENMTPSVTDGTAFDGTDDIVKPGDEQLPPATVSYLSPDISGFQFSVGVADTEAYSDTTMMGAQYVMAAGAGSVTLKYAASSTGKTKSSTSDDVDHTSLGLVIVAGNATLTMAQNTSAMGTVTDYTSNSAGVTYKVSDTLTIQAYSGTTEDDKDTTYDLQDTGLGFTYTVAPGLTASVTHNTWDLKADDIAA